MSENNTVSDHELFTKMLFTDALVGLGIPEDADTKHLEEAGFITWHFLNDGNIHYAWRRESLEAMQIDDLQALYLALKYDEVTAPTEVAAPTEVTA